MSGDSSDGGDAYDRQQIVPVIHKYRDLIGGVAPTSNQEEINASLPAADELYQKVIECKSARAAHLDAIFLRKVSTATYKNSRNINVDNRFEPTKFMQKLITRLGGRRQSNNSEVDISNEAWKQLGKDSADCFSRALPFHFMLGSFDRGPKVRKPQIPKNKNAQKEETDTKYKELQSTEKSQQERTTEEVEKVLGVLTQLTEGEGEDDKVNYFDFVIDPDSFSHTVENIFHLSFLVKDGYACIELDEYGLPVVYPTKPYRPGETREKVKKKQLVMSMSVEEWQEIIDAFDIKEALIPPTPKSPQKRPSKSKKDQI